MTLYDYISSLTVGGSPLVWSSSPLTQSQVDAAAGKPYVRVEELPELVHTALYGKEMVLRQDIDVRIFQSSLNDGRTPVRHTAMKLYFDLFDAEKYVNKAIYGQPLIAIHASFGLPPNFDKNSAGLAGMVRYRLLFPRG